MAVVEVAAVLVCPVSEPVVLVLEAAEFAFCESEDAVVLVPPVELRCADIPAAAASILSGINK